MNAVHLVDAVACNAAAVDDGSVVVLAIVKYCVCCHFDLLCC